MGSGTMLPFSNGKALLPQGVYYINIYYFIGNLITMTLGYPPTEKRALIAADYDSPGPIYFLPPMTGQFKHDPRSQFDRAPSFVFGRKHKKSSDESPGPVYKPHPHLTTQGLKSMPAFSMYQRHELPPAFNTPGVGTYATEAVGPSAKKRAPQYSFAKRLSDNNDNLPGKHTNYNLPGKHNNYRFELFKYRFKYPSTTLITRG